MTKVRGMNLRMIRYFSRGINGCLLIQSDLACSFLWNSTSWAESWTLGFMLEIGPRKIFFRGFHTYNMALKPQCMRGQLFAPKLKFGMT